MYKQIPNPTIIIAKIHKALRELFPNVNEKGIRDKSADSRASDSMNFKI